MTSVASTATEDLESNLDEDSAVLMDAENDELHRL